MLIRISLYRICANMAQYGNDIASHNGANTIAYLMTNNER
jgi:hypothetical protein